MWFLPFVAIFRLYVTPLHLSKVSHNVLVTIRGGVVERMLAELVVCADQSRTSGYEQSATGPAVILYMSHSHVQLDAPIAIRQIQWLYMFRGIFHRISTWAC